MTDENDGFDAVEPGDKIAFTFPHGNFEGEETVGGVGDKDGDTLVVKAGAYYHIGREDFVRIEEKQAY